MPNTLQDFLSTATQKMEEELVTAFLHLPEEKRAWSPAETARTALDQMAECAILNGYTADLIQSRTWPNRAMEIFFRDKAELCAQGWEQIHTLLQENTRKVIAEIRAFPEEALKDEVTMPWGNQTLAEILAYPYWNMSYHLGQINYIASILGCLP